MACSLSSLLSTHRESTDDPWQDTVCDVVFNELLDLIAEHSSGDEEEKSALNDVPKKRARRQFGPESSKRSFSTLNTLSRPADECMTGNLWLAYGTTFQGLVKFSEKDVGPL